MQFMMIVKRTQDPKAGCAPNPELMEIRSVMDVSPNGAKR